MRIGLIYLGRHGPGGPISFELASHLSKKTDLFVVASRNADHIDLWRRSGLQLMEVETFDTNVQALMSCFNSERLRELASAIRAQRPHVILWPMVHPWTPALENHLEDIPHVVTVHDPAPHPGFFHAASSLWETMSAVRSTRCVVLGRRFIDEMRSRGLPPDKIDVIPHAVFSFYERFVEDVRDATPQRRSLLFFGRITAYKGIDVLIAAFRKLQEARPDLQLKIVGEGDFQPYRKLVSGVANIEVVNRWVDDAEIPRIFRSADVVVVPYVSASQSGVIALAANFGCPVIATRVGAIPEQIRDRETGILVNPGARDDLAQAIEGLLADDGLRRRLGNQLALETKSACNWDVVSDLYLESCRKATRGFPNKTK